MFCVELSSAVVAVHVFRVVMPGRSALMFDQWSVLLTDEGHTSVDFFVSVSDPLMSSRLPDIFPDFSIPIITILMVFLEVCAGHVGLAASGAV